MLKYTKFKNERRILIGYWLAQQLLAVRDVHCTVHVQPVCVCAVQCVWDQTGSNPGACD